MNKPQPRPPLVRRSVSAFSLLSVLSAMSPRDHDNRDGGRDSRGSGNDKRDFYHVNDKRVSGRDYRDSRSWKGDRDSGRDTGGRDNSRKSRSRSRRRLEVPQTGSSKSGFPPAPPPYDRDRYAPRHPSPDRMINDATSLLKTLHMSGDLPSLGRGLFRPCSPRPFHDAVQKHRRQGCSRFRRV